MPASVVGWRITTRCDNSSDIGRVVLVPAHLAGHGGHEHAYLCRQLAERIGKTDGRSGTGGASLYCETQKGPDKLAGNDLRGWLGLFNISVHGQQTRRAQDCAAQNSIRRTLRTTRASLLPYQPKSSSLSANSWLAGP